MEFVSANEKGVSVKLSDQCQDKIFTDRTDSGKDIVIVKGRVVRVDSPSANMGAALSQPYRNPDAKAGERSYTLLVETDETPTEIPQTFEEQLALLEQNKRNMLLAQEAAKYGFTLTPHSMESAQIGDVVDTGNNKIVAGQVATDTASKVSPPSADVKVSDSGAVEKSTDKK